jgi:hypothetical protein
MLRTCMMMSIISARVRRRDRVPSRPPDGVHDRLLVVAQQPDETLVQLAFGVDAKVAEEDLKRDAAPSGGRDGFSADPKQIDRLLKNRQPNRRRGRCRSTSFRPSQSGKTAS